MENTEKQNAYFDVFKNPDITEREKYKYYIQNDTYALNLKEKVKKTVTEKGLSAVMNDTKWLKLQSAIDRLPFPPPYMENLYSKIKLLKKY